MLGDKTELPTVDERCETCRYWECMFLDTANEPLAARLAESVEEGTAAGFCRRFPPPVTKKVSSPDSWPDSFPRTIPDNWCGEWRAKAVPYTVAPPRVPEWQQFTGSLSVRLRKSLYREGIDSFVKLLAKSENDILEIKNFGLTTLRELKSKLEEHGLYLSDHHATPDGRRWRYIGGQWVEHTVQHGPPAPPASE